MKITMVLVEIRSRFPGFSGHYSEGVASISAAVKSAGHDFELIHLTRLEGAGPVSRRVEATRPHLIGVSCTTNTFQYVPALADAFKKRMPSTPIILGGVHAILNPGECIAVNGVDAVCPGEGEGVVVDALDALSAGKGLSGVDGIWIDDGKAVTRKPTRPLLEDLGSLPDPDRTIFDFSRLLSAREGILYALASRGCPYPCRFCCNSAIREKFPNHGKYVRRKDVNQLCAELASAIGRLKFRVRLIHFQDEIMGLNRTWLKEFADRFPKLVGIPLLCNLRADLVTPDTAKLLREAGCRAVCLGLETGSVKLRTEVLGKRVSDEQFLHASEVLHSQGIHIHSFNMVGLPGETVADAIDTIFLNADANVDRSMISIFYPYPNTELYCSAERAGILSDRTPDTYQSETTLNQDTISPRQVRFLHDYFSLLVSVARKTGASHSFKRRIVDYVNRNGVSLAVLSIGKRLVMPILIIGYLTFGRHLFNRVVRYKRAAPSGAVIASTGMNAPLNESRE